MKKKILLLHGWNNKNYTQKTQEKDAWNNRKVFVDKLKEKYDIYKLNFPGFCGEPEPKKEWHLDDYANYVKEYLTKNNLKVDYILGYSFGGAVAIRYSILHDNNQKLILISPAIIRNMKSSIKLKKTPKIIEPIRKVFRDLYLKYIVKNKYMVNGTKFLNRSYQNIVRVNLIEDVKQLQKNNFNIIYGTKDTQVNPGHVINTLGKDYEKNIHTIIDGGHDIANTNPNDIIKIIEKIDKEN